MSWKRTRAACSADLFSGKTSVDALRKRGMTDDQIRELVSGPRALAGRIRIHGAEAECASGPDPEALKLAAEIRKRQRSGAESRQTALSAGVKEQLALPRT